MSGGSPDPETEHDKQCPKCGLYYRNQGPSFKLHTDNCTGNSPDETSPSDPPDSPDQSTSEDGAESPIFGSGDAPESAQDTELPCGHESIDLDEYDSATWIQCDTCQNQYPLT
jgi:hypothetical protein